MSEFGLAIEKQIKYIVEKDVVDYAIMLINNVGKQLNKKQKQVIIKYIEEKDDEYIKKFLS